MNPLTINGPIPFGVHRTGTLAQAEMRQRGVVVVGEPGSGKTVTEHTIIAGLVRCPDDLVWLIDLGGAGLTLPWLGPWFDRDMSTPVIDWPATTVEEALAMVGAGLHIVRRRKVAYRSLMRSRDTDLLPVDHDVPAIHIVVDEGKRAAGLGAHPDLIAGLTQITDEGRGAGVRVVMTGLRATSDVIPTAMMRNTGIRIGMSVADEQEGSYLFGYRYQPNPDDFPYPGCGVWRDGLARRVEPFRSFDLSRPSLMARLALACEPWRPELDEPSLTDQRLIELYEGRWDRVLPHLTGEPADEPGEPEPVSRSVCTMPSLTALDRKIAAARMATMAASQVDQEWSQLVEQLEDARVSGPQPRTRALELLDAAGQNGLSGPALHRALLGEGLSVARSTLYDWLNADAVDGGYGRYVHPRHGRRPA